MRLFEAILDANHRALAGDESAGLHPADFPDSLPVAALTCIDPRLNPLFPDALGLPREQFIWLRNAGNIITGSLSSTMRSLALSCAVKGAKEIAIIGHTDCQVCKTSTAQLTDAFAALGVNRANLPSNLTEFFGLFASERQNVLKAVEYVRHSPIIGPNVPVHGLLVDVETGNLDWVSNGYQTLDAGESLRAEGAKIAEDAFESLKSLQGFVLGEIKFPETKIGELASDLSHLISNQAPSRAAPESAQPAMPPPAPPPAVCMPPKAIPRPPRLPPVYTHPQGRKFR